MSKHGEETRIKILEAGVKLWPDCTARGIAKALCLTHTAVLYHFPNDSLRSAVAAHAVKIDNSRVIVQLIANGHAAIATMSKTARAKHLNLV